MKIVQIHNNKRFRCGEDTMFAATVRLLREKGHEVVTLERDSRDVIGLRAKVAAFFEGIYSRRAKKAVAELIASERPDIVHVHNLYPFFSASVVVACREGGVPVVMRCPNYRLICPEGLHLCRGDICERCCGGREYWCVLRNCRHNILESLAYALRNAVARKWRLFRDNVTLYLPPTEFVKRRLVDAGFPEKRIIVVPNMVSVPDSGTDASDDGEYVVYAGRISPEKGIDTLLTSARQTGLPVRLAGDYSGMPGIVKTEPANAQFTGHLNRDQLGGFYGNARFSVVPTVCFESFGLVVAEAMSHGLPVIASRIGGLPEIVEDGVTGLLFEPGNAEDLAEKMKLLWDNPDLCRQMGQAGREKAVREYSENVHYERLMAVYEKAIKVNREQQCCGKKRQSRSG
jgi:glycosyltransferase involved in cell wall biosynthesis